MAWCLTTEWTLPICPIFKCFIEAFFQSQELWQDQYKKQIIVKVFKQRYGHTWKIFEWFQFTLPRWLSITGVTKNVGLLKGKESGTKSNIVTWQWESSLAFRTCLLHHYTWSRVNWIHLHKIFCLTLCCTI